MTPSESMQNVDTRGKEEFDRYEVLGYGHRILSPMVFEDFSFLEHFDWAQGELHERLGDVEHNPGEAWKLWPELWTKYLDESGHFDYTYRQQIWSWRQIECVVLELEARPNSRRAVISIWDDKRGSARQHRKQRVPCSMYYQFFLRDGNLDMIYNMRSCDLITHYPYDVALACGLRDDVIRRLEGAVKPGWFQHHAGSLHAYRKDLEGVF